MSPQSLLGFRLQVFLSFRKRNSFSFQDLPTKIFLHTCCSRNTNKQSKMLNKLLSKGKSRKKVYFNPVDFSSSLIAAPQKEKKLKVNVSKTRRAEQVSRVLFSHISDLIQYANEDFPELEQQHIEISKVKISADFSALCVYWLATGTEKDDTIQEKLVKNSSQIRQNLINLHFVGTLPPITFIPDFSEMQYQTLMTLLKSADMGPEEDKLSLEERMKQQPRISSKYIGVSLKKQMKDDLNNLGEPLSHDEKKIRESLEKSTPEKIYDESRSKTDFDSEKINFVKSEFENNVYQLDHPYLMKLVQEKQWSQRKKKSFEFESSQEQFRTDQKIMDLYYQKTSKKKGKEKENSAKLKEYNYISFLKEKYTEIKDEE